LNEALAAWVREGGYFLFANTPALLTLIGWRQFCKIIIGAANRKKF
jgi:hypothetical protein